MKRLWTPWRMKYVLGNKPKNCIFCERLKENKDKQNYILLRGTKCFVMLNTFPYNNGHLMIAPYEHLCNLSDLDYDTSNELIALLIKFSKILEEVMHTEGMNVGINIGKAAGAGEEHLHVHIVPRWQGDTNFIPVIAETKVIPELLDNTYSKLLTAITQTKST